jgi:hypothetical protein
VLLEELRNDFPGKWNGVSIKSLLTRGENSLCFKIEAKTNPEDLHAHPYWSLKIIPVYKKVINLE